MTTDSKIQIVKYAPPPAQVPSLGKANPRETTFIGRTNYTIALEEKKFVFGIKRSDRRRNVYVIGKSGVGKSKLLELMIRQDIAEGYGLCLVDPHGDLIEEVLDFIPENRMADVLYIDPLESTHPVTFNPLANVDPETRHELVEGLIQIFEMEFGSNWTPGMEYIFRFAALAVSEDREATLRGLVDMFTDSVYRARVTALVTDDTVRNFWEKEYDAWAKRERVEIETITPLVNRLRQFVMNPFLRTMFEARENRVDFDELIRDRKIVLVKLAKAKLGKENASFLGALIILKIRDAGMRRLHERSGEKKDFYLYIEEFHHMITETFENLMFEGRRFGIPIVVAHQYLNQVTKHFQSSIFGNVGTIIVFRVGGDDAERLESELAPIFKAKDMINLGTREFYIKMIIDGEATEPFSAETLKILPAPHASYREGIIAASRQRYGRMPAEKK